jgi:hypothetical protein
MRFTTDSHARLGANRRGHSLSSKKLYLAARKKALDRRVWDGSSLRSNDQAQTGDRYVQQQFV